MKRHTVDINENMKKYKLYKNVCNRCKNPINENIYTIILCNSVICRFFRSLSHELPKIKYNHTMKCIYNKIKKRWNIPTDIITIIIQYNPLIDMVYNNTIKLKCETIINNWTPGYECNCIKCGVNRLFE